MTNLTDEQIRELVPNGVYRATWLDSGTQSAWKVRPEGDLIPGPQPAAIEELTPSQVAERVLRCEECKGRGELLNAYSRPGPAPLYLTEKCPECSELVALLLKLARERVAGCDGCGGRGIVAEGNYDTQNDAPCPNCSELRTLLLKLAGEGDQ